MARPRPLCSLLFIILGLQSYSSLKLRPTLRAFAWPQDESPLLLSRLVPGQLQHPFEESNSDLQDAPDDGPQQPFIQRQEASAAGQQAQHKLPRHSEPLAGLSASLAIPLQAHQVQCERLELDFCSTMPFSRTRMPNFFGDKNQIEASDRAKQYKQLIESNCSNHLLAYLCELLAPMCLDDEVMKKFEIYPCRSFCRQIKRDCEPQLATIFGSFLDQAFVCDQLPYESNGGNGSLHGPCHDAPEVSPSQTSRKGAPAKHHHNHQQQQHPYPANRPGTNYQPWQPSLDNPNVPPFIPEETRIEADILDKVKQQEAKRLDGAKMEAQPAPIGANLLAQLQSMGQSLANGLIKYSNLITCVLIVCLLCLLFAKQINRLKMRLISCPRSNSQTSGSSSSSSSVGSKRKLASGVGSTTGNYPPIGVIALANAHKVTLSPSSSSRSLMLFAGGGGSSSGKQHLQHKLISTATDQIGGCSSSSGGGSEPSQKLLHGLNQKTLIDVDGTFERRQNRYHLMQGSNLMGTPNHLGKQVGQPMQQQQQQQQHHEYDYIQMPASNSVLELDDGGSISHQFHSIQNHQSNFRQLNNLKQPQESPQLFKNILLSSPSHQVLLFGGGNQSSANVSPPPQARTGMQTSQAQDGLSSSNSGSGRPQGPTSAHHKQHQLAPPNDPAHQAPQQQPFNYLTSPHYATASLINNHHHSAYHHYHSDRNQRQQQQQIVSLVEHQRSFSRRGSRRRGSSTSSSGRRQATAAGEPTHGSRHLSASSNSSSASSSSFSPPSLAAGGTGGLQMGPIQASPRTRLS